MSSSITGTKEVCSFCRERPFDVVCQCGDKFDFSCIIPHVEAINIEYDSLYTEVGERLAIRNEFQGNYDFDTAHRQIDAWVRIESLLLELDGSAQERSCFVREKRSHDDVDEKKTR